MDARRRQMTGSPLDISAAEAILTDVGSSIRENSRGPARYSRVLGLRFLYREQTDATALLPASLIPRARGGLHVVPRLSPRGVPVVPHPPGGRGKPQLLLPYDGGEWMVYLIEPTLGAGKCLGRCKTLCSTWIFP